MDLFSFAKAFLVLFIITDPLGNLPVFLALTGKQTSEKRQRTLRVAVLTGFVLLLFFSLIGQAFLSLFNISLTDFKIAGGALLFVIGIKILIGDKLTEPEDDDVGAVPLGCPLLAGPGAITTTIVLIGDYGLNMTLYAVMANFLVSWIIFNFANTIYRVLGETGSKIIARIMAILIAAVAVKYLRIGIFEVLRSYK